MTTPKKNKVNSKDNTRTEKGIGGNRSNQYDYYTSPEGLAIIMQSKRDGLTNEQLAQKIGITRTTLYEWGKKNLTFYNALKVSKAMADANLENKAYKMAMEGNTTMMIFLLKNRMSDKYKDRQEVGLDVAKEELKESVDNLIEKLGA